MRASERWGQRDGLADGLSPLVAGKTVSRVCRRARNELLIEFTDGTMLAIDAARAEFCWRARRIVIPGPCGHNPHAG